MLTVARCRGSQDRLAAFAGTLRPEEDFLNHRRQRWSFSASRTPTLTLQIQTKNNRSMGLHKSSPVICKPVTSSMTTYFVFHSLRRKSRRASGARTRIHHAPPPSSEESFSIVFWLQTLFIPSAWYYTFWVLLQRDPGSAEDG